MTARKARKEEAKNDNSSSDAVVHGDDANKHAVDEDTDDADANNNDDDDDNDEVEMPTAVKEALDAAEVGFNPQQVDDLITESMGYKMGYFNFQYELNPVGGFMKEDATHTIRIQVYYFKRVISVCIFEYKDDDNDDDEEEEDANNSNEDHHDNDHGDDNDNNNQYDSLFNPNNKIIYVVKDLTIDLLKVILQDPVAYSTRNDCASYYRNYSIHQKWIPIKATTAMCCANCEFDSSDKSSSDGNDDNNNNNGNDNSADDGVGGSNSENKISSGADGDEEVQQQEQQQDNIQSNNEKGEENNNNNEKKKLKICTRCRTVAYCSTDCQKSHWEEHKPHCKRRKPRCDMINRWHHVALASGLVKNSSSTTSPTSPDSDSNSESDTTLSSTKTTVLKQILDICTLFDSLLYDENDVVGVNMIPPDCLCHARYGCGAICCLSNLLLDIGRQYHDVIGFCPVNVAYDRFHGNIDTLPDVSLVGHFAECSHHDAFTEEFGTEINILKDRIVALPPDIRAEIIMFQFERIRCRETLAMITHDELPLIKKERTFQVHLAMMDYSRLLYGDNARKHMCLMHGTLRLHGDGGGDDDDNNEDDDDQTAETAVSDQSDDGDDDEDLDEENAE